MAYSNWGAFVYRAGKRRRDCEDVPIFGDRSDEASAAPGARIWINLMKAKLSGGEQPPWGHTHHAVLGDGPVRLVGYKSYPALWIARGDSIDKIEIEWSWDDKQTRTGEIDGYRWTAEPEEDPEAVSLSLVDPDGTVWTSRCGYCIGAGHEDDPDPPDAEPVPDGPGKFESVMQMLGAK